MGTPSLIPAVSESTRIFRPVSDMRVSHRLPGCVVNASVSKSTQRCKPENPRHRNRLVSVFKTAPAPIPIFASHVTSGGDPTQTRKWAPNDGASGLSNDAEERSHWHASRVASASPGVTERNRSAPPASAVLCRSTTASTPSRMRGPQATKRESLARLN